MCSKDLFQVHIDVRLLRVWKISYAIHTPFVDEFIRSRPILYRFLIACIQSEISPFPQPTSDNQNWTRDPTFLTDFEAFGFCIEFEPSHQWFRLRWYQKLHDTKLLIICYETKLKKQ